MNTMRARCHPQRPWTCHLERDDEIVALDGPLLLRWREPSLDGLADGAPACTLRLDEGERHRVRERVRMDVEGLRRAATALVMSAPRRAGGAGFAGAWRALVRAVRSRPTRPPSPSC